MKFPSFIKRKWYILLALAAVLFGVAFYPFESAFVPVWGVRVMDVEGKACAGNPLVQEWAHFTRFLHEEPGYDRRITDDQGYAVFPERTIRASMARRIFLPWITPVLHPHLRDAGLRAFVTAPNMTEDNWTEYQSGQALSDLIRVERCLTEEDLRRE